MKASFFRLRCVEKEGWILLDFNSQTRREKNVKKVNEEIGK
jgi:hypothetical protein